MNLVPRLVAAILMVVHLESSARPVEPLRVCADAANLPFSDRSRRGFENSLAQMVATDLRRPLNFRWFGTRNQAMSGTHAEEPCELLISVPTRDSNLLTTQPYYRSSFVFVSRADRMLDVRAFHDPRLRSLRVGVLGSRGNAEQTPPARLAAEYGLASQLRPYDSGDRWDIAEPARRLIDGVLRGDVDIAVGWGPILGYFAARSGEPLDLRPIEPDPLHPDIRMRYAISMGVSRDNTGLRARLDELLERQRRDVDQLLSDYHVPRVGPPKFVPGASLQGRSSHP